MKSWNLSDAKAKFSEVVASAKNEPQVITNRREPVAVLISMDGFEELQASREANRRPTIAELLDELKQIYLEEPDELELPPRIDRPVPSFD